jgi:hypothetical protein
MDRLSACWMGAGRSAGRNVAAAPTAQFSLPERVRRSEQGKEPKPRGESPFRPVLALEQQSSRAIKLVGQKPVADEQRGSQ